MQLFALLRNVLWPEIPDAQSALTASQRASKWVLGWSILLVAIGLLDLVVSLTTVLPKTTETAAATEFVWYTIGAGLLFGLIAWRVSKNSLGWAIGGLAICIIGAFAILPSPFGFAVYVLLGLIFVTAIRAASKHKRTALSAE
jgi:fucose permease